MSLTPLLHYPLPHWKVRLWHIFFVFPAMKGMVPYLLS